MKFRTMEVLASEEEAEIEQAFGLNTSVSADTVITAGGAGPLLEVVNCMTVVFACTCTLAYTSCRYIHDMT